MLLEIQHELNFTYDAWIHESRMELRIQPRTDATQIVQEFHLLVGPRTAPARAWEDWLGNIVHWFGVAAWHERIEVLARSVIEPSPAGNPAFEIQSPLPYGPPDLARDDFTMFGGPIIKSTALEETSRAFELESAGTLGEWIRRLSAGFKERFEYQPLITTWESNTDHLLETRAGVCQDFAHLAIALARLRGIPTRYVNGYLHIEKKNQKSQSHAWVEFWSPDMGWIPYDPTHHQDPGEQHVVVAYGRNYNDCPPNRGLYSGMAIEALEVSVQTRELKEITPRRRRHPETASEIPTFSANPISRDSTRPEFPNGRPPSADSQQQQQQ